MSEESSQQQEIVEVETVSVTEVSMQQEEVTSSAEATSPDTNVSEELPEESSPQTNENTESKSSEDATIIDTSSEIENKQQEPTAEVQPSAEELAQAAFQAVYDKALESKDQGTSFYKAQQYMSAKVKYAEAMGSIQNQSGDFSNEQRAIIFEMSLTCSSNMALCSWSLNEHQECIIHGRNTLLLIGALESKMSDGMIWEELQKKGMTVQKLVGLKLKAYRITGKAELEKGDYEAAKSDLEAALKICDDQKLIKELTDLIQRCSKKLSQQSKKEKSIWKKAFDTNSKVPDEEPISLPNSPTRIKPSSNFKTPSGNNNSNEPSDNNNGALSKPFDFTLPLLFTASAIGLAGIAFWWMRRRR